jgi:ubiquitin
MKKRDDKMNGTDMKPEVNRTKRKDKIRASFKKAVKQNGKALEKLSKN